MAEKDSRKKIATLVFMDLETTGLAFDVGKKNVNITEMSFVAVDRQSFERDQDLRVINKLSLCVRPRSVVSPTAMDITGLYNDILEQQKEFDKSVPKLLEYFFRRLQIPVCLLAHNGLKFDFPVLQAELKRINYALHPQILCADTIQAFRSILTIEKPLIDNYFSKPEVQETNFIKDASSNDEIDLLLSQDMDSFLNMKLLPESAPTSVASKNPLLEVSSVSKQKLLPSDSDFLDPSESSKTPKYSKQTVPLNICARKRKLEDTSFKKTEANSAKRVLFPNSRPNYSLEGLYTYCFGEKPPQAHHAENDCINLSKLCQKMHKDFLEWIDINSQTFCHLEALW